MRCKRTTGRVVNFSIVDFSWVLRASTSHVGIRPMLRPADALAPLFEPKNTPLLELPLLVRVLDPLFFFTPPAPDLSLRFVAPSKPPLRLPRPPRKLAEPLL